MVLGTAREIGAQQPADSLLAVGDTLGAIAVLRDVTRQDPDDRPALCRLGSLLTLRARPGPGSVDWRVRYEAERAFQRALRVSRDPQCLYAYAQLKEKQGFRVDAARLLRRVDRILRDRGEEVPPTFLAELLYRRALLLDDWLRNFDYLVRPVRLAVSTPECLGLGYFCENFVRPTEFNLRLASAADISSAVADEARLVVTLLDSALALDPTHPEARRLRLRRAVLDAGWTEFEAVARAGVEAAPEAVFPRLALLAALVQRKRYQPAASVLVVIDSLTPVHLRGEFERLRVIGIDSGQSGAALWQFSDPLYLTAYNERRLQHYARLALADVMFTDPLRRVRGRDTQPGRLVLRYGWPKHIWEVPRDSRLEMTPEQARVTSEVLSCVKYAASTGGYAVSACVRLAMSGGGGRTTDAGGRWTFFNYGAALPSFVFERGLSQR